MDTEINYKRFINYFTKWEGAALTGTGLLAFGAFCLWIGWGYSYYLFLLSIPSMIVGVVFFLYGNIGRATEADIRNIIPRKAEKLTFEELEEDIHLRRRTPKNYDVTVFEGFDLHPGVYIKKLKNASLCSSEYDYAKMVMLNDAFYIKTSHFSFIADEEQSNVYDIAFDKVENIVVERSQENITSGKNSYRAKNCHLVIVYDGGQKLALRANDDIYIDEMAENLKRKLGI